MTDCNATEAMLEELERLMAKACPGPWRYERHTTVVATLRGHTERVADCSGSEENPVSRTVSTAQLIVALRNALPELLRLARLGLESMCSDESCARYNLLASTRCVYCRNLRYKAERDEALAQLAALRGDTPWDELAALLGCPQWEYPGQIIRDVKALMSSRDTITTMHRKLEATLAAVARERDEAQALVKTIEDECRVQLHTEAVEAENVRLREALAFYANPETWCDGFAESDGLPAPPECAHEHGDRGSAPFMPDAFADEGEKARAALAATRKS
ncbi:MAG TPA: hypothetical protein VGH28_14115 [Polyangiaceae bacterium]|jgi:hypothetical protein